MTTIHYQRTRARVVRAGHTTAHLSIPAWASGHITVAVPTLDLMDSTGLTRRELTGAHLIDTANVAATQDTDVDPHDWQLLTSADDRPAAHTLPLSAA